jgi:hypothetical protein
MSVEVLKISDDDLKHLAVNCTIECTHKLGAVRLDSFPLLVFAPMQESHDHPDFSAAHNPLVHGNAVRTEDRGILVSDIVVKAATMPDYQQLADYFGTSTEHIHQVIDYAVKASTSAVTPGA